MGIVTGPRRDINMSAERKETIWSLIQIGCLLVIIGALIWKLI